MDGAAVLARLAAGDVVLERTAVIVAHPDDETIGMGGRLNRFARLTLITATNGAPTDMGDARRAGFSSAKAYGDERRREQGRALAALQAHASVLALDIADQDMVDHIAVAARRLTVLLAEQEVVITHAYEGGHPDHDACAMAVQLCCQGLGEDAPVRLEFAAYHERHGDMVRQRFWPDAASRSLDMTLTGEDLARKSAAFAAYVSQADMMRHFAPEREAYRLAPVYDFTRPPPPGAWLYDSFGFALKGDLWLERAGAALVQFKSRSAAA